MEDRFTRFLNKIGIEDTTPYENCAFSITSYDKVNNICYINIHKEHCFNYIDAKRLLDAINNAPFKNVINFTYGKGLTSQEVYSLLRDEFIYHTGLSADKMPKCEINKNDLKFSFYGKVHYQFFTPVMEMWEELLDELNLNFDLRTDIVYQDSLVKRQEEMNEVLKKVNEEYAKRSVMIQSTPEENKRRVKGNYVKTRICDINEFTGNVEIEGQVFKSDERISKKGKQIVTLFVYDHTDSISITIFGNRRNFSSEKLDEYKKLGAYIKIRGGVVKNNFSKDLQIVADFINPMEGDFTPERYDEAEEKRVELHAHTKMSNMDGVASVDQYFKQAAKWGMKAFAITDHYNVQSFPDAQEAAKKYGIKAIYGCEMNMVDDSLSYIFNPKDVPLNKATYVVFDFETTGLSARYDRIIEFGAVKFKDGLVQDTMDLLIDPNRPLSKTIKELTHITDEMLRGRPKIKEALKIIRDFIEDENTILVTHNAQFDIGFLNEAFLNNGYEEIKNPVVDTLSLARYLFPDNKSHSLGALCRQYQVDYEEDDDSGKGNHYAHRADYDARVLNEAWQAMLAQLTRDNINLLHSDLNKLSNDNLFKNLRPSHVTVYAKNPEGLKDLFKLVSLSNTEYFAYTPKIPKKVLEAYRKNLLIGSACYNGEIFDVAQTKGEKILLKRMKFYDFIEVQPPSNYVQLVNTQQVEDMDLIHRTIKDIIDASKKAGKLCVATGDCHYLSREEKIFRDVYVYAKAVGGGRHPLNPYVRDKLAAKGIVFENPDQHFRSTEEMLRQFSFLEDYELAKEIVVTNSNIIADMMEPLYPIKDRLYPPHIENCDELLQELCWSNAKKKYGDPLPQIVKDRLNAELTGIVKYGFTVQYYIASKIVRKTNEDGFMVGSRGSVGSSFVATMADITEVNPLQPHYRCPNCLHSEWDVDTVKYRSGYDLPEKKCPHCGTDMDRDGQNIPFATFLGFKAEKVPDIDLNFSGEYQAKAHDLTKVLLGVSNVYRAGTIETVAEKTAYGYALGYYEAQGIDPKTIKDAEITRLSLGCQGVKRTTGQHPGGIIVIPGDMDVYDFTPIQYPADDLTVAWKTTHFDFHKIHDNVLKLDLLGHVDPTALKMLSDITGIDSKTVPLTDRAVISLFNSRDALKCHSNYLNEVTGALGLPEFGTPFVRQMLIETRPKTFADLLIISGLSHGTDVWNGNAQDLINDGVCSFQEVIGCRDDIMTGLSLNYGVDASKAFLMMERVRKGKKLTKEDEDLLREHKVPEWYIGTCNKIKYLFPKAHAVAYVMMACRVAWYKVHYPLEYYAVYFSTRSKQYDIRVMSQGEKAICKKLEEYKNMKQRGEKLSPKDEEIEKTLNIALEMTERGYKIGIIDLNKSLAGKFVVDHENNMIIPPFDTIDNLGTQAAQTVVDARNSREFLSVEDLSQRTKLSQQNIENLRKLGSLKGLPESNQLSLFDFDF